MPNKASVVTQAVLKSELKEQSDHILTEVGIIIQDFATQVDERFNKLEASLDKLINTLDGLIKRLDDLETDNVARDAQLARLDRWVHQIANKTGVKLKI